MSNTNGEPASKLHGEHAGHEHSQTSHNPDLFRRKFWISLALTVPTIYFSDAIQSLLGYQAADFGINEYLTAALGVAVLVVGGWLFVSAGLHELRAKKPGMMALIALALAVSALYSSFLTVAHLAGAGFGGMDFWWELSALVTIMLLGHWIELISVSKARNAIGELAHLLPRTAERVVAGKVETVELSQLKAGNIVLVRPGGAMPADGVISSGSASVNESMVTGESRLVSKAKGDGVLAGTVLTAAVGEAEGALKVRVIAVGGETAIAKITRLVVEAQSVKSKTQTLADRAAGWLFYAALAAALVTAVVWALIGTQDASFVIERTVTVLVIACPHALGLAIPLVSWATSLRAARDGVLIRSKVDFEAARNIDVVLFDKTGTLTDGQLAVQNVHVFDADAMTTNRLVALAAGIEAESGHALARGIRAEAKRRRVKAVEVVDRMSLPGIGVSARLGGERLIVGGPAMLMRQGITLGVNELHFAATQGELGFTTVYLVIDDRLVGLISLGDQLRDNTDEAIEALKTLGKKVAIVSGDSFEGVEAMAKRLGVEEFFAEVLPQRKIEIVKQFQQSGRSVAMIGDGVNDAPALAQADVGIAVGEGTDVVAETAGLLLLSGDPMDVANLVKLSKRSYAKMQQNLWWATGYNLLAIPAAAGLFMGIGVTLIPAIGVVLMSVSTLLVAANAHLLRR